MATTSKRRLTDEERDRRRAEDCETARRAVEALQSSAGWQQWLRVRRRFHFYSLNNQLLIAMQRAGSHCLLGRGGVDMWSSGAPGRAQWYGISALASGRWRGSCGSLDCL